MYKYREIKAVGRGAFGEAHLCERKDNGSQCIIKKINVAPLQPKEKAKAMREVGVLKTLRHPNIVRYIESFEDNRYLCIVMEYCEGGDLDKKIRNQNVSERQIWDWFKQLCRAIKYLHSEGVMHRDLKPDNIFLTRDGTLKVGDFGLAKFIESYGSMQHTQVGAIGFRAPEIFETDEYSKKCDIWSLGCTLYCMTMRAPPFDARDPARTMMLVLKGKYPSVSHTFSAKLRSMIDRLLTKDPNERPSITQILQNDHVKTLTSPETRLMRVDEHNQNEFFMEPRQIEVASGQQRIRVASGQQRLGGIMGQQQMMFPNAAMMGIPYPQAQVINHGPSYLHHPQPIEIALIQQQMMHPNAAMMGIPYCAESYSIDPRNTPLGMIGNVQSYPSFQEQQDMFELQQVINSLADLGFNN